MLNYVATGHGHDDLAERIDQELHAKPEWPRSLANKGLRRYTEWRTWTVKGDSRPDMRHRGMVANFVDQLRMRMKDQAANAPLSIPVVLVGFSNNPHTRLGQHRQHESSNYLMNLAEAVFAVEYPQCFRLQQRIVFACFRPIQAWLSEIIVTQLAQGYVERGGGFSHKTAGRSNTSSNEVVPSKIWTTFEQEVYMIYEDGKPSASFDEWFQTNLSSYGRLFDVEDRQETVGEENLKENEGEEEERSTFESKNKENVATITEENVNESS